MGCDRQLLQVWEERPVGDVLRSAADQLATAALAAAAAEATLTGRGNDRSGAFQDVQKDVHLLPIDLI